MDEPTPPALSHLSLFLRFLRFGLLAFGGPVAQIAMIRRDLVERERWISGEGFNRLLAVMQALPGPEAHELCVHLGIRAKGRLGGLLAGLGFMLPGFLLMLLLAWAYFALGIRNSVYAAALLGLQIAVVAIIARAAWRIGGHILKRDGLLWLGAAVCGVGSWVGVPFWLTLPAVGAAYALARSGRPAMALIVTAVAVIAAILLWRTTGSEPPPSLPPVETGAASVPLLLLAGLKAGLLTFGGAYTAIPFLRTDVVQRGWVDDGTFLDGVALAQVIPAPLIIFGTFAGYAAGGFPGALAMTAGIFIPAFAFSMIFYDRLEAVVRMKPLHDLLDGIAAGAVGLIAATAVQLGLGAILGAPALVPALAIFVVALVAVWRFKGAWLVPAVLAAAGVAGFLVF